MGVRGIRRVVGARDVPVAGYGRVSESLTVARCEGRRWCGYDNDVACVFV